jgi:hypothetical protein
MPNIAIVWDFDGTLTPQDSTTEVVKVLRTGQSGDDFWKTVKSLRGDEKRPEWRHVRSQGGMGIAVYDPSKSREAIEKRLRQMRLDRRTDLITAADFSPNSELFEFLSSRCTQIAQRYRAQQSI